MKGVEEWRLGSEGVQSKGMMSLSLCTHVLSFCIPEQTGSDKLSLVPEPSLFVSLSSVILSLLGFWTEIQGSPSEDSKLGEGRMGLQKPFLISRLLDTLKTCDTMKVQGPFLLTALPRTQVPFLQLSALANETSGSRALLSGLPTELSTKKPRLGQHCPEHAW